MEQHQPKHLSPWIAWSLVILFAGIALFCAWEYYFQLSNVYDNQTFFGVKVHKTTTTSTPTTASATADWKTYTNDTIGLSFKYPADYIVENETLGTEKLLRISNHSTAGLTKDTAPSDIIAMSIAYENLPQTPGQQVDNLLAHLPTAQKHTLTSTDGINVVYYVYYSDQASDYSTENSSNRMAQILAYFTKNNQNYTAQIDNYEWTPKSLDQKQVDFIVQLLGTAK